ncbi:MAG: FkbM family methyltransferase [Solidesulfovibrio sp. DCME]|uniref:FkbM family methyltransferase n=1 Tax=Solidesulfovibrio sp. DCME TaxID=3447380 RepID=UPI003D095AAE
MSSERRAACAPGAACPRAIPAAKGRGAGREAWLERLAALPLPQAPVIVDGGANKGNVTARLLTTFPGARVEAFEPQPRLARKLAKRFAGDARVRVHALALGEAPATLTLSVMNRPTLSSLLPPTGIRDKYAGQALSIAQTIDVPVARLDAVLDRADVIKLDLQGYELPALRGATVLLGGVSAIVAETARTPLYAGQALLPELEAFLGEFGFTLDGVYECFRDGDGRIVSGDALFRRA